MELYQKNILEKFINDLKTDSMKKLAERIFEELPDYWFTEPASSSGKYHPIMSCGEAGLFRHSLAVEMYMSYILNLEQYNSLFTVEQQDALKLGAFVHDGRKHGEEDKGHTVFDHPVCMANAILKFKGQINGVSDEIIDFLADSIKTHMGQWNTDKRSNIVLEKPHTEAQKLVHLCDYLASRKAIDINFDVDVEYEKPTKETYVFTFGKHKGENLISVAKKDPTYINWLKNEWRTEPLKSLVKTL